MSTTIYDPTQPDDSSFFVAAEHRGNFEALHRHDQRNYLQDPLFECWPAATTLAAYALSGTGATQTRSTVAADLGIGSMGPNVVFGSANAILQQVVLDTGAYDDFFDGLVVTAGIYAKASAAGIARLDLHDGVSNFTGDVSVGTSSPEWLTASMVVGGSATALNFRPTVIGAGNVTWSGATFLFSNVKPVRTHAPVTVPISIPFIRPGNIAVELLPFEFPVSRPFVVNWCQIRMQSKPNGAAAIFDLEQWDGSSAYASMYSTRPQVADGAASKSGGAEPDGTYNRRCFQPTYGSGVPPVGGLLRAAVDQIGSTDTGANATIVARGKGWARPQELFASGEDLS